MENNPVRVSIETVDLAADVGLFSHVESELRRALGDRVERLSLVQVRLVDVNGPLEGGVDKQCTIALRTRDHAMAMFDEVHSDARVALELTLARVSRWVEASRPSRRPERLAS